AFATSFPAASCASPSQKATARPRWMQRPCATSNPRHVPMKLVFISTVIAPAAFGSALRAATAIATSSSVMTTPPWADSLRAQPDAELARERDRAPDRLAHVLHR